MTRADARSSSAHSSANIPRTAPGARTHVGGRLPWPVYICVRV